MLQTDNLSLEESNSYIEDANDIEKSTNEENDFNQQKSKNKSSFYEVDQKQLVENLYKTYITSQSAKKLYKRELTLEKDQSYYEKQSKSEKDLINVNLTPKTIEKLCNSNIQINPQGLTGVQGPNQRPTPRENHPVIEFADSFENCPGNYQNYVTKSLKSIIKFKKCFHDEEYINILNSKKINLGKQEQPEKKTLILDLDETLIHADFNNLFINHDKILTFKIENFDHQFPIPILIRPGLKQFLQIVSEKYEVVVFTASKKEYANTVLNYIDPENKFIKHRLYREQCIPIFGKLFIKDLRIFNDRRMENIVIVDNSMYSFANQLSNGILITSFFNDRKDMELINLGNYLVNCLVNVKDIRTENEKFFKFESMLYYKNTGYN